MSIDCCKSERLYFQIWKSMNELIRISVFYFVTFLRNEAFITKGVLPHLPQLKAQFLAIYNGFFEQYPSLAQAGHWVSSLSLQMVGAVLPCKERF